MHYFIPIFLIDIIYLRRYFHSMWVFFGLISAVFLSSYDVIRKHTLNSNSVIPVLFFASTSSGILFVPFVILSFSDIIHPQSIFFVPSAGLDLHIRFFLKSLLVGSSWFLAYSAIDKLPLTIVVPIRSTGPMYTLFGALFIFEERYSALQWVGLAFVLIFFYLFTLTGRKEGIKFLQNKWIFAAIGATILGAASSLYDKYLFSNYNRMAVQAWYSIYMILVMAPVFLISLRPSRENKNIFRWTPYIPLIGILLVVSDFLYFYALTDKESSIAILAILRRSSVILSFISGAVFFGEKNIKRKAYALVGILTGIVLIIIGSV